MPSWWPLIDRNTGKMKELVDDNDNSVKIKFRIFLSEYEISTLLKLITLPDFILTSQA